MESPEEIVAITFTIKAAGEMRERVLAALADARAGKQPNGPHEARTLALARAALARDGARAGASTTTRRGCASRRSTRCAPR